MYAWNWDPFLVFSLIMQAVVYLAVVGPLRRFFPDSAPVPQSQIQTFLLGNLVLFAALVSPLHTLGDNYLLTAHMIQHLLITLLAPPLLLMGTPRWLFRPLLRLPFGYQIGRLLTHPVVTFFSFNLILIVWHFPVFYDAALQNELIHIAEHVTLIVAATLTWWPICSPMDELPQASPGVKCLYLFFQSLPPTILGAVIAFAGTVLYPTYAAAPRVWGLSAETDQQLGGFLMWMPGGLVYFVVLTVIFFRWFGRDEYEPVTRSATG